jgi:hypothetical protein
MNRKFNPEELHIYEAIHSLVSKEFPKTCACGRKFVDELDYTLNTVQVDRVTDYREMDFGFHFSRNHFYRENERRSIVNGLDFRQLTREDCPREAVSPEEYCGSTLAINVTGEKVADAWRSLEDYTERIAEKEGISVELAAAALRDRYNQYLILDKLGQL